MEDYKTQTSIHHCLECGRPVYGRTDKVYCSPKCKNRHFNRYLIQKRQFEDGLFELLYSNYKILETLTNSRISSISISKLAIMGFRPDIVSGVRTVATDGSRTHVEYLCLDMAYVQTSRKIFGIHRTDQTMP